MKPYKYVRTVLRGGSDGGAVLVAVSLAVSVATWPSLGFADAIQMVGPLRSMADVTQPHSVTASSVPQGTVLDEISSLVTLAAPQRLVGSDVATGDYEGASVTIDGDTAVVAAPYAAPMGRIDGGAVYVFVRNGTTWTQQAKLLPSDGRGGDNFGTRVALRGDTLVIGAPGADLMGRSNAGAAYIFQRSGTAWSQIAKLTAFDGASEDQLGFAVALDGDIAVIGARGADIGMRKDAGAAYVFSRRGPMWFQQAKLTATDGGTNDSFGVGVAVSGDTAIVGADFADIAGKTDAGAAYVFQRGAMGWSQQAKLTPMDGQGNDWFGRQVAIDGSSAIVSALYGDTTGKPNSGSAYVFTKSATGWNQQAKLGASDAQSNDWFGYDVSISGEQVLVGAAYADLPMIADAGAGYSFVRSGTMWTQSNKLNASDPSPSGFFGNGVSVDGDTFLVGAPGRPPGGAAYAFIGRKGNGEPCLNASECGSGFCTDGVCCNSACGGGAVDCQACSMAAGAMGNGVCGPARGGTVCRASQGSCDQAETCSGNSMACPTNILKPRGSVCRAATHRCDAEEQCDGVTALCASDASRENGAVCELGSCQLGQCRAEADLSVEWEVPGSTVTGMTPSSLPLLFKNKGLSPAFDVTLSLETPPRSELSVAELPGFSCTTGAAVVECVIATLPVGETHIVVNLVPPPVLGEFEVTARAKTLSTDPDDKNNQATLHVKNDNPLFEQIAGGGRGCAIGGFSPTETGAVPATVSSILAGLLLLRRRRHNRDV